MPSQGISAAQVSSLQQQQQQQLMQSQGLPAAQLDPLQQQQQSGLPAWAQQALTPPQHFPGAVSQAAYSMQDSHAQRDIRASAQFMSNPHAARLSGQEMTPPGHNSWQGDWQQQQQLGGVHESQQWPEPHAVHHMRQSYPSSAQHADPRTFSSQQQQPQTAWGQEHNQSAWTRQPHAVQAGLADEAAQLALTAQSSGQGGLEVPFGLSRGSSGLNSPLQESGHFESLLEVNNRVEAAMDRARAHLQASTLNFT